MKNSEDGGSTVAVDTMPLTPLATASSINCPSTWMSEPTVVASKSVFEPESEELQALLEAKI